MEQSAATAKRAAFFIGDESNQLKSPLSQQFDNTSSQLTYNASPSSGSENESHDVLEFSPALSRGESSKSSLNSTSFVLHSHISTAPNIEVVIPQGVEKASELKNFWITQLEKIKKLHWSSHSHPSTPTTSESPDDPTANAHHREKSIKRRSFLRDDSNSYTNIPGLANRRSFLREDATGTSFANTSSNSISQFFQSLSLHSQKTSSKGKNNDPLSMSHNTTTSLFASSSSTNMQKRLDFSHLAGIEGVVEQPSDVIRRKSSINHSPLHHQTNTSAFKGVIDHGEASNSFMNLMKLNSSHLSAQNQKWRLCESLGKGTSATVKLAHGENDDKLFAIKKFRKMRKDEDAKSYGKKVLSEFCISSSLRHANIIQTVDLIQEENARWFVVMEYMAGGDLFSHMTRQPLSTDEAFCFFKQLLQGVSYLHSMGVVHRDLKPENLLLDENHRVLKITDFGSAEVFKTCFMKESRKLVGVAGSDPYIAPEEWLENHEYDPAKVDIWSCGIIFHVMTCHNVPWKVARQSDGQYKEYIKHQRHNKALPSLTLLSNHSKAQDMIYHILDPDPGNRPSVAELLKDEWLSAVECCIKVDHFIGHLVHVDHIHSVPL